MEENSALAAREKTHLLVVEDEPIIRQLFTKLLSAAGYSVSQANDGFAALGEIRRRRPALILSDLNMPRMTGFELLSVIRRRFPAICVIAMSGAFDGDQVPTGVAADAYYQKSGRHIGTLVDVIEGILISRPDAAAGQAKDDEGSQLEPQPDVALWVTRRGTSIEGPYILLNCPECLRCFPHCPGSNTMQMEQTPCVFCGAVIRFALLDPNVSHHPGYAPAAPR